MYDIYIYTHIYELIKVLYKHLPALISLPLSTAVCLYTGTTLNSAYLQDKCVVREHTMNAYVVWLHRFLNFAPDNGLGLASRLSCFIPKE